MRVERYRLPEGLPARFTDSKTGLTNLQDLLGLSNRKEWQSILHAERVKSVLEPLKSKLRGLRSSQRVARSITAFYSVPDERREAWELHLGLAFEQGIGRDIVPSLEYEALKRYDSDFLDREIDAEIVEQSLAGISDRPDFLRYPNWQQSALAVWPDIRQDLIRWRTLSTDQQEAVGLAAFAVATIMDDVRFLDWAAGQAKRLAQEFAFALSTSDEDAEGQADFKGNDARTVFPGYDHVLQEWNRTCDLIVDIAADLKADPPEPERLDDLIRPVKRLEALREHLLSVLEARNRAVLLSSLADTVAACAEEFDAPWLAEIRDEVHAQWKLTYRIPCDIPEEVVKDDAERVKGSLKSELRRWRKAENTKARCRAELADLILSDNTDLESQLSAGDLEERLHNRMSEAARHANEEKRRVLRVIAPNGKEFEPARDYKRELEDAEKIEAVAGVTPPLAAAKPAHDEGALEPARNLGEKQIDSSPDANSEAGNGAAGRASENDKGGTDSLGEESETPVFHEDVATGRKSGRSGVSARDRRADEAAAASTTALSNGERAPEVSVDSSEVIDRPRDLDREGSKPSVRLIDGTAAETIRERVAQDHTQPSSWDRWLDRVGDPDDRNVVRAWGLSEVPECSSESSFRDPHAFAKSLTEKLASGLVESAGQTLRCIVQYLNSDRRKGRREWQAIYRSILDYCLHGNLDGEDSQKIAYSAFLLMLKTNPGIVDYKYLIDAADRLTELAPDDRNVRWSLELADLFLCYRCPDESYLDVFLDKLRIYVSNANRHLPSKLQTVANQIRKRVEASGAEIGDSYSQEQQELCRFLRGKKMVIYTLQRPAALTIKERIQAIEPSIDIRLLHNKVWSENLRNPIRNADICVMVKSAATHAVTEMIARTRKDVGKESLVPSWKGVHSLLREIYRAAGIGASALEPGPAVARAVA